MVASERLELSKVGLKSQLRDRFAFDAANSGRARKIRTFNHEILGLIALPVSAPPPINDLWYSRVDSNHQDERFELSMSARLHHASKCKDEGGSMKRPTRGHGERVTRRR